MFHCRWRKGSRGLHVHVEIDNSIDDSMNIFRELKALLLAFLHILEFQVRFEQLFIEISYLEGSNQSHCRV